jgi:hypothetical protein
MSGADNVDARIIQRRFAEQEAELRRLKGGGGGGTSGPMNNELGIKDYVDAKNEAVETRLLAKLDKLPTLGALLGVAATVVGVILAAMAFGGDRFDSGMGAGAIVENVRKEQRVIDQRQNAKLSAIDQKLDLLVKRSTLPFAEGTAAAATEREAP